MPDISIHVTIDRFSGRPNVSWHVRGQPAEQLLDTIIARREEVADLSSGFHGLGLRGLIVEIEPAEAAYAGGVPPVFRVAATGSESIEEASLALTLLQSNPVLSPSEIGDVLRSMKALKKKNFIETYNAFATATASAMIQISDVPPPIPVTTSNGICKVELGIFNPVFWNGQTIWLINNNCYNYATNRRTNSFAQPGAGAGHPFTAHTLGAVTTAALLDGLAPQGNCLGLEEVPRWLVALVTVPDNAPDWDFHWYRALQGSGGTIWGHKPGGTIATTTDNSGQTITNPQTCDRGDYTVWGGYFYVPSTATIT